MLRYGRIWRRESNDFWYLVTNSKRPWRCWLGRESIWIVITCVVRCTWHWNNRKWWFSKFVMLFTCWFYLDNNSPNPNKQNHNSINQRCHWISRTSWGLTWSDKNSFYKKTFRMGISLDYMTRCVCAPDQSKVNVKLKKRTFLNFRFLSFATFYHIIGVFNCRPVETIGAAFILFRTHRYKPISKCYLLL